MTRAVSKGDRLFAGSNAQVIVAPEPLKNSSPAYDDDDLLLSSHYIDINVISVPPEVVLVNDACPELARFLEHSRFPVVRLGTAIGGSLSGGHCFTLDTVREDGSEITSN
ncbi:hypothetical protein ACNJYD_10515 [Bradyrhizobium sp. DASA03005]|uniref:hypothetical protein n=1 Tax=Bradyrhizobium sp. SPXBL-02 TaxID=3395912 RepID=UPI003F6E8D3F